MPEEICFGQTFAPRCGSCEVIVVTTAAYGRMDLGKCIQSDLMLGCQGDASQVLDGLCSGRSSCSIEVDPRNPNLADIHNCPSDMLAYLEVEYSCLSGLGTEY